MKNVGLHLSRLLYTSLLYTFVRKKVEFLQGFPGKFYCQIIHISVGAESLLARQGDGLNCFQDSRECYRTFRISGCVSKPFQICLLCYYWRHFQVLLPNSMVLLVSNGNRACYGVQY